MDDKLNNALEALKVAPAPTATTLILFGVPLSEWVIVLSAILITLQLFFLIRDKVWKPWKERNGS